MAQTPHSGAQTASDIFPADVFPALAPARPFVVQRCIDDAAAAVAGSSLAGSWLAGVSLGCGEAALARPVVAIGNFDGVHAGHRAVIAACQALAREVSRPAAMLTFAPHPRSFFNPDSPVFRITPDGVEETLLARLGLDGMIILPFNAGLAAMTAQSFFDDLLVRGLGVSGVVVGHDFHFGKGREGSPAFLQAHGARAGVPVRIVEKVSAGTGIDAGAGDDTGEAVSSSLIRAALRRGDVAAANTLLGYRWFVRGEVLHGRKLGRTLNYPTANIRLPDDCDLAHGIYAVRVLVDGVAHGGVASFGRRPTFDNGAPLLESFLFDFNGDLYGKTLDVEFLGFLRGEEKFDSVDALIVQMDRDSAEAKAILARNPPLQSVFPDNASA